MKKGSLANKPQLGLAVIILSGGIDSTTLLYDISGQGYEAYALSVNYNQKHLRELDFATATCRKLNIPHKIIDISKIGRELLYKSALTSAEIDIPENCYCKENMKLTIVPNRNMILLSLAIGYAISLGAEDVFYGAHAGDHAVYPDCRKDFVDAMRVAAGLADWTNIKLHAPYLKLDKEGILRRGTELGVDYSLTWTCYKGLDAACGGCGACTERLKAFDKIGAKDPIEYRNA